MLISLIPDTHFLEIRQKAVENNNAACKDTLNDNQIVDDLTKVNILASRRNGGTGSKSGPSLCKASGSSNDEELTSLSWLQNTNLLQSTCILSIRNARFP